MISNTENKSKSREWEKETMTPNFNVENLQRDQKPRPTTDRKHPLWRTKTEYKVLPSSNLSILPKSLD